MAALSLIVTAIAHSYLGERYILIRLLRRDDLPVLFGGTEFTMRTLRFAWHLTTVAWLGFAAIIVYLNDYTVASQSLGNIIGVVFLVHSLVAFIGSRGKHLAWITFLITAVCVLLAVHT